MLFKQPFPMEFLALIFIASFLSFGVESVTVKGRLRNYAHNTKCLRAVAQDNGAELDVIDCSDPSTIIEANGFQNMENEAAYIQMEVSSKCLSLNGFDSDNGVHILLWDCVGQDNQKWSIVNGNAAGPFQLQLKSTGKCLTAEGDGTYVDQWDCVGTQAAPHQSWTLDIVNEPPQVENFKGRLRNYAFNTKCLNAVGGDNGAELNIVDCADDNQALILRVDKFYSMGSEAAYIQFDATQKCVSLNGFAGDNGVHMLIWDCVDQNNQKFTIVNGQLEGAFQLQLKETGKCLTAEGDGTYIDQWDCVGTQGAPHQSWTLDVVADTVIPTPNLEPAQADDLPPPNLKALLRNHGHNTKCLRATAGGNGAELEIVDCSQSSLDQVVRANSFFEMRHEAGYIQFDDSQKCLSLNGFAGDNGVHILTWDCVDQDNQKWSIVNGQLGGPFQLQLKQTGKCLTAEAGGTYLDQYDCAGTEGAPHQSWTLEVIDIFGPEPSPQIDLNYKGILRNYGHNTKCLHAVGGDNGAELEIVDCSASNQDQLVRMESFQNMEHEHGYVQFDASGKCLSLNGFSSDNGVRILIWDCVDQDNQKWQIVNGDLGHSFQLRLKSTGKCLTAEEGGAYLDQYDCAGTEGAPHQSWTVDKVFLTTDRAPYTFYLLENFDKPNHCLRYKDGSAANYATELAPCNSEDPSQRIVAYTQYADELGYSGIQFAATGNCLDVAGESNTNGAAVGHWSCVNQANQRWRMEDFQDGSFRIRTEIGDRCLTSESGGSFVDIYDCYGRSSAPHQYWKQRNPNEGRTAQKLRVLQNYQYPDKCLHTVGTSKENGAELELIDCNAIKPEESMNTDEWLNYDTTSGYVKFNGKCLSMSGFASDNGVRLIQWDCVEQANQRWQIVNGDIDSNFQLKSEQSGKCLTAEGEGAYMDQYECYGRDAAPHQSWMIRTIGGGQHDEESLGEPEIFFEPAGALLQMVEYPGKCLSVSGVANQNEVILADCDAFDENQLFDHTDLLNYNTNPGLLKLLGTNKCLTVSSNNHVTQVDCDIGNLNELWHVILGNLFGTFKLKSSQSMNCITPENGGAYTDVSECVVVSDSRKRRDLALNTRGTVRMSYKMSQPDGNKLYLIRSAYYPGYCLSRGGAQNWPSSDVGIELCDRNDEAQQWHFEQTGKSFENKFFVRNGPRCLWSMGNAVGKPLDYHFTTGKCTEKDEYIFTFLSAGSRPDFYHLQNVASGLCMQINWYEDEVNHKYVDYVEQQPCGLVGWSKWQSIPLSPYNDHDCGPRFGGKFCTGKYAGMCCSIYGGCGTTGSYCARLKCDPRFGPCIRATVDDKWSLDNRCGPWAATLPNKNGRCTGLYTQAGYCCGNYGVCGNQPEHCLGDNCDPEYGWCPPPPEKDKYPGNCGPLFGNKKCTGRFAEMCCSKNPLKAGSCATTSLHCNPTHCDSAYGMCYSADVCLWAGNSKKTCRAGDCCSKSGKCGNTEEFCGKDCDTPLSCGNRCNGGLTTTAVGLYPEQFGTCQTTACSPEGAPCSIKGWCCSGLRCVADPDNATAKYKAKKCVQ